MDSSLTASLFLLSVVFMQFVSAQDQNISTIKAEPGENVILTCKDPDQGKITIAEWKRTDLGTEYVLLYKDYQLDPDAQHPSYRDRVDLLFVQLRKGDVSLLLKDTTTDDSGTYECRIYTEKHVGELISTISLQVSPRPPVAPRLSTMPACALRSPTVSGVVSICNKQSTCLRTLLLFT
uniref:Ig-like domain-containing protein n=1 Tax=Poecilia formosa TaxID=48698 RepID=A0A087X5A4_POEFO